MWYCLQLPVERMVGTLTSTSPICVAVKRGPFGIVCNDLHADIFEQKVFPGGLNCRFIESVLSVNKSERAYMSESICIWFERDCMYLNLPARDASSRL